jgi:hypothetical protein
VYPRHPSPCRPRLTVESLEDRSLLSTSNLSAVARTDSTPPPEQTVAREATATPAADAPVKADAGDPAKGSTPAADPPATPRPRPTLPEFLATNATARPCLPPLVPVALRRHKLTPTPAANPNRPVVATPIGSVARPERVTTANVLPSAAVVTPSGEASQLQSPRKSCRLGRQATPSGCCRGRPLFRCCWRWGRVNPAATTLVPATPRGDVPGAENQRCTSAAGCIGRSVLGRRLAGLSDELAPGPRRSMQLEAFLAGPATSDRPWPAGNPPPRCRTGC